VGDINVNASELRLGRSHPHAAKMDTVPDISMLDPPYSGLYGNISPGSEPQAAERDFGSMSLRASQACIACRKQKRKCNKALPACSLCQRMVRPCDYSDSTPTPNADDFALLRKKVTDLEARLESQNVAFARSSSLGSRGADLSARESPGAEQVSLFPSLFVLEAEMFQEGRMTVPRPKLPVPNDAAATLGTIVDIRDIVERFFENIHLWLPIVSKKRMQLTLSNPRLELSADLALLLLSMKLITQSSHGSPQAAQTPLYAMTKRQITLVESGALLSLHLLQALVLTAAYEIGHAIYPAAYLTTGHTARIGHLMGLHDRKVVPQVLRRSGAWAEIEEIKRTWWACMLLDRYINLGIPGRPLATDDPSAQSVLPADDASWDMGEMATSEPLYVSTPTSVRAGPFARTCQATHLMGRLVRVLNDRSSESPLRFVEAAQLHRTLTALGTLLAGELQQSPAQYSTPVALCYSAIVSLDDPFCCTQTNRGNHTFEETEMQALAILGIKDAADCVVQLAETLKTTMNNNISAISPLTANALYVGASTYAWLAHESGSDEHLNNYHELRQVLLQMKYRWAVAGEYLDALDATKNILYQDNPNI
jgi:Fungal specific transcription factor domain/Fungal Zn(2)-Cys(6) binuclear cluster domain